MKIELELAVARVQSQRPAAETTEVEACVTTYMYFWFVLLWIINRRLLTEDVGHG